MNTINDTHPHRQNEDRQLADFVSRLKGGPVPAQTAPAKNPEPVGKARSAAAAREARSAGRDGVQTNANKVNPPKRLYGAEKPGIPGKKAPEKLPEEVYKERLEAAEMRRSTRQYSGLKRVQKCCHTVRREAGVGVVYDFEAKAENRVSGYRGLYTCSSVWACDRCGALIQRQRFLDSWKAMDMWTTDGATIPTQYRDYGPEGKDGRGVLWTDEDQKHPIQGPAGYIDARTGGIVWPGVNDTVLDPETGELVERKLRRFNLIDQDVKHAPGGIAFMTLTLGHERATAAGSKYAADPIWTAENAAFKVFTNSKFFKGNIHAYQRSVEVQYSNRAGWHIHIHVSLYVSKGFRKTIKRNADTLFAAWQSAVALQGYEAKRAGFDLRMSSDLEKSAQQLAQYVSKGNGSRGLAAEMTINGAKKSRYSVSPGQIRALLHEHRMGRELSDDALEVQRIAVGRTAKPFKALLAVHQEYERASRGKRWMTWSRGAKKAFDILETTDETLTEASEAEDGELVLDQGTAEIGGFKGGDWRAFAREVSNPVELRHLVELFGEDRSETYLELAEWNEENGYGLILGQAWQDRLDAAAAKKAEDAKNKAPKWASGLYVPEELEPETVYEKGSWTMSDPATVPAGMPGYVDVESLWFRRLPAEDCYAED